MRKGKVFIVGAGPGDPGLLTLRAQQVLARADVVVYDALIHPGILGFIPEEARRIFRGHRSKPGALTQGGINRLLVRLAKKGLQVVRLKGGDPYVFGRGAEEALELQTAGIDFEVVPGISSCVAVPAYAGIPVTHRAMNSSFTVVTGHEDPTKPETRIDWANLAANGGTLVFLMGLHNLPLICERLMAEGKGGDTPAAVIEAGTTAQQRMVKGTLETLATLAEKAPLHPPATVVVGKVVGLSGRLQWFTKKSLAGIRVLLTRTRGQSSFLSSSLSAEGAEVIEIPTIEIAPLPLPSKAARWLKDIGAYDWLVFSSSNAVDLFMKHLFKLKRDARDLKGVKIACVGGFTARCLKGYGVTADLVPEDYKQEGLVAAFRKVPLEGRKVLFARAKEGRDLLLDFWKKRGARVHFWPLYENRVPRDAKVRALQLFSTGGGADLLTFASSSSVDHFYSLFTPAQRRRWLSGLPVAVIGPVTGASARKWGCRTILQPRRYTMPDLVAAIVKWAGKGR